MAAPSMMKDDVFSDDLIDVKSEQKGRRFSVQ